MDCRAQEGKRGAQPGGQAPKTLHVTQCGVPKCLHLGMVVITCRERLEENGRLKAGGFGAAEQLAHLWQALGSLLEGPVIAGCGGNGLEAFRD